jgi:enoyl-CoA hydratase/carnithine racemase
MSFEHILFDLNAGIAKLTLNRPKSLNSFNEAMHLEVRTALDEVEASDECRVLLITGAGRGFCAGQDLSDRHVKPGDEASWPRVRRNLSRRSASSVSSPIPEEPGHCLACWGRPGLPDSPCWGTP